MGDSAVILDGRKVALRIQNQLIDRVQELVMQSSHMPCVAVVQVGQDERTERYVRSQQRVAERIGIEYRFVSLDEGVSAEELLATIQRLNRDESTSAILVQQPLPMHINGKAVSTWISPHKDIEGVHPDNVGGTVFGEHRVGSCTALAVMRLIEESGVTLEGAEAVIVGHSEIVGRPLSLLLLDRLATTCVCHIATTERGHLEEHVRRAEILVAAVGNPGVVPGEWIRPGAVVVDVGINLVDGKLVGDVVFDTAVKEAGYITPVPGGVGPVTVAMLMKNAVELATSQWERVSGRSVTWSGAPNENQ